jgi:hypothetical protein
MARLFFKTAIVLGLLASCKTQKTQKPSKGEASTGVVSGVFDNDNNMLLAVPTDIGGLTPPQGAKTEGSLQDEVNQNAVNSLGLSGADPVSSRNIEEILYQCYTQDSEFVAEGWYFYARIMSNGEKVKDFQSQKVDRCNQMQLTLKTLDINRTYTVKAAFYWQSEDKKTTIVWYEGETRPFKPRDENRALVLRKLRMDQKLNVDVEKSAKDKCIDREYLWNGQTCLDKYVGISFVHADYTDYGDPEAEKSRKCLTLGSSGSAFIGECRFSITQRVKPKLTNVQRIPKTFKPMDGELGWFTLRFDTGNDTRGEYCLAARRVSTGHTVAIQEPCGDPKLPPAEKFLWNLIPLNTADQGGRDAFKIVSQADGQVTCLSAPPEEGTIARGAAIRDGAPIRLTPCNIQDENIKNSQPIQFWTAGD